MSVPSLPNQEVASPSDVFVRELGTDGVPYIVVPLHWTLDAVELYYEKFKPYRILSDDAPQGRDGFEKFVLSSGALWFEVVRETDNQSVGIVYVADFIPSAMENRFLSASYHISMWDSHFSSRIPIQKAFVRAIFAQFRLHRLEIEIPLFAGGAIRVAKKAGFIEEGVRRKARRYNGTWWNVLHLAIVEDEVS